MKHWLIIAAVGLALALAAGGYAFGRYAAPDRVVTQTKDVVHTVTVSDTRAEQQVAVLTAQVEELKKHTHTERTIVTRVDGSKVEHDTQDVDVERATQVHTDATAHLTVAATAKTDAMQEHTTTTTVERDRPQWFAGALFTISPGVLKLAADPKAAMSVGVIIGRHILGPIAAGLSVSVPLNQPVQVPTFGLTLTMEF